MGVDDGLLQLLDQLLTRVDSARAEDAVVSERTTIEDVIRQLESLSEQQPSAEVDYALAYAWYFHPERQFDRAIQDRISTLLVSVTRAKPDDFRAWLYLGHNAYDAKRYKVALDHFRRACAMAPESYLGLKAQEMLLCSMIQESGLGASLDELERFVARAEKHTVEDIWPQQLASVLEDPSPAIDGGDKARLGELLARLDRAGHWGTWFAKTP